MPIEYRSTSNASCEGCFRKSVAPRHPAILSFGQDKFSFFSLGQQLGRSGHWSSVIASASTSQRRRRARIPNTKASIQIQSYAVDTEVSSIKPVDRQASAICRTLGVSSIHQKKRASEAERRLLAVAQKQQQPSCRAPTSSSSTMAQDSPRSGSRVIRSLPSSFQLLSRLVEVVEREVVEEA
jgi:hypothetical protein